MPLYRFSALLDNSGTKSDTDLRGFSRIQVCGNRYKSVSDLFLLEEKRGYYKLNNQDHKDSRDFVQGGLMPNEFTAIFERDGDWYIAYCPEIPGANGQGKTKEEARASLADAIALVLDDRRKDALRGIPPEAELETVTVK
jgi:predicted RNase H-like HicB family nuclease